MQQSDQDWRQLEPEWLELPDLYRQMSLSVMSCRRREGSLEKGSVMT